MNVLSRDHVIVGTAGHIDHGKTALIKALTGIDADTLSEEKRRGITIELGFVFLEAPETPKQVVFIDVPGHEKLIKTMVAGASNIDVALLVIAADEGISVQTREHFDILRLLDIPRGIIALTKSDLVSDARISQLTADVGNFTAGSFLEGAPVIPVSAVTGNGVDEIRAELLRIADLTEKREDSGIFRMPVDRVFTMSGFGTVIAGTILSGGVKIGDQVEIYPERMKSRVRGVQVHHQQVERSNLGKRTALNLPEIKKEQLRRGQCAASPGTLTPTFRLDGRLFLLKGWDKDLRNRTRVRLHIGTAEVICRVMLMDRDRLKPGESAAAQFVLEAPTVALPKDRFVIRSFSPLVTIGGGRILDAQPEKHKRFQEETLAGLERLEGDLKEISEQVLLQSGFNPMDKEQLASKIGEKVEPVAGAVHDLLSEKKLVQIQARKTGSDDSRRYLHVENYQKLIEKLTAVIGDYFKRNPHRQFMPAAELRSSLREKVESVLIEQALHTLVAQNKILYEQAAVRMVGYQAKMSAQDEEMAKRVEAAFLRAGYQAPLTEDVRRRLGVKQDAFKRILRYLGEQGRLVRLDDKVTYHTQTLDRIEKIVVEYIRKHRSMTLAELRDELHFSRKYAQSVLEYFDRIGLTKRVEDRRILAG